MQNPETNGPVDAGCNSESIERRAFPGRPYDLLPIGHMAASLDGRLLRANPNLAAMLGCAGEEELHWWCKGAAQDLFEESTDWNALVSLAETRGELVRYPAILRQRDGTILPCMVWARLSPWPWAGVRVVELVVQSMAERHQAFSALTQVLRLYRDMMDLNPDPVLIHEQKRIMLANRAAEAFFGLTTPGALVGRLVEDLLDASCLDAVNRHIQTAITNLSAEEEFQVVLAGGAVRWLRNYSTRITFHGKPAIMTLLHDRTGPRQAEELHRAMVEHAPDAMVIHDDGVIIFANLAAATLFHAASPAAMIGWTLFDLFHPDSRSVLHERRRMVHTSQGPCEGEYAFRLLDGEPRHVFARSVRVSYQGRRGLLSVFHDLTGRHRAEAERDRALESYEDLFQSAPQGIALGLPDHRLARVNRRMAEIFGYPTPEAMKAEVACIPTQMYADPEDYFWLRRLLEHQDEVEDFECLARRRDGTSFWTSRSIRVLRGRDGRVQGFEAFVRDITERRTAKEEAAERGRRVQILAGELAMASERERRGVARELHDGPVQQLALATLLVEDLARRQGREKDFGPALDLLREVASQLRSTMDQLTPPALFSDSLAGTLACLGRDFLSRHGLKVDVACTSLPGLSRDGVAFLCRTVRELLVNAIKHGRAGQARVLVDVRGTSLWLTVVDDGKGFDTFLLDAGEPRSQGLPGLRSLCRDLGGGLVVESAPGKGTRVVLDLPLDPLCAAHPLV